MISKLGVIDITLSGLVGGIVAVIGVIVWLVRQEGLIKNNKVSIDKLESSTISKMDKLEQSVSDKMDKFESHMAVIEKQGQDTKTNIAVIESDTKHIRGSIHSLINLFNQHVLTKEISIINKD